MAVKVLYEVNVTDLKMADRGKRILRSAALSIFQLAFIFVSGLVLGIWAMLVSLLAVYLILPIPIIPVPSKYKVTSQGVILNERRAFSLKKGYKLRANEERKFISVLHGWRGEILRLYTPQPKKVMKILGELIRKSG